MTMRSRAPRGIILWQGSPALFGVVLRGQSCWKPGWETPTQILALVPEQRQQLNWQRRCAFGAPIQAWHPPPACPAEFHHLRLLLFWQVGTEIRLNLCSWHCGDQKVLLEPKAVQRSDHGWQTMYHPFRTVLAPVWRRLCSKHLRHLTAHGQRAAFLTGG
mmetsp:Transcript_71597/g.180689  ORF Transcript_71597/g.180689 Transcript_71597/m.180689 type:complete len:160 (-) Transcript_71597:144-623(-)